jgi:hypothetical protein
VSISNVLRYSHANCDGARACFVNHVSISNVLRYLHANCDGVRACFVNRMSVSNGLCYLHANHANSDGARVYIWFDVGGIFIDEVFCTRWNGPNTSNPLGSDATVVKVTDKFVAVDTRNSLWVVTSSFRHGRF